MARDVWQPSTASPPAFIRAGCSVHCCASWLPTLRREEIEMAVKGAGLDWAKYRHSSEVANFIKVGCTLGRLLSRTRAHGLRLLGR